MQFSESIIFQAVIIQNENFNAGYVEIPEDVATKLGASHRTKVKVKFDGVEYRGSLAKMQSECLLLGVRKEIRQQINKQFGDTVTIEIEVDKAPRIVTIPDDVIAILDNNPLAKNKFNRLSYSHQKEHIDAINEAKKPETRAKRINNMLQQLSSEKQSNKQILRTIFLIFAFNFSVIFPVIAADSTVSKSVCNIILSDFNAAYSDGKYLVRELLTPQIGHLLYPGVGISSTIVASQFDERIRYPEHSRYTDRILKQAGELSTAAALPSIIYVSGLIFDDVEVRTTGRMLFESLLLAGVINGTLKYSLGRARPFMNMDNSQFEYFEPYNSFQSLPSGHTTVAFTCASLLSERINNIYASIALYAIAGGTAYERIRSDNHWFSDVVLGAGIGIFSAYSIVKANKYVENSEDNNSNRSTYNMQIMPMINHSGFGLRLSAEF